MKIDRNLLIKIMFYVTLIFLTVNGIVAFGTDNNILFFILSGFTLASLVIFKMAENNDIKKIGFWHLVGTCDYKKN
ncbi:MAG: hypothetical protein AB7E13_09425 [Arcobacteraceae bacterium]